MKSQICHKCSGSGRLNWTDQDAGICYKCEGAGYLGEMPEGFQKGNAALRNIAKEMLRSALIARRTKGEHSLRFSDCEGNGSDAQYLYNTGKPLRFKYTPALMEMPDQTLVFGGGDGFYFTIIIGGEFVEIKADKK